MGSVTPRSIKIIRNRPTRFTEQKLNKVALGRLRELVLFSNWSRRVFLSGYGKEAMAAVGEVNSKVLAETKQAYKTFTLMDNVYDCPDSWFWFENAAAYTPYIVNKGTPARLGRDVIESPQSIFLNQVRAEMVNPNSKFSPSFIGWASALRKSEVCFSNVSLRSVMSQLGYLKSKMNFVFPLRLKRRKVAQTASYSLFKKQWRQLSRSKQLASQAKVLDLTAWARSANNLDVSWLAKKLTRSFNKAPVVFWWRKKPRRHMYWKLIKKRKPQKKFKATRAARRLIAPRRTLRPMLLPRTGLFSICNPFNGRWSRTPARWPFKQRRVVLRSLKKSKTRRVLLQVQGLYLRWVRFFVQQYFWFSRQCVKSNIMGSEETMNKFLKWAKTRDVFVSDLSIGVGRKRGLGVGSARPVGRFSSFGLRRKLYWNYTKVGSAYWAGVRALTANPLGSVAVIVEDLA